MRIQLVIGDGTCIGCYFSTTVCGKGKCSKADTKYKDKSCVGYDSNLKERMGKFLIRI